MEEGSGGPRIEHSATEIWCTMVAQMKVLSSSASIGVLTSHWTNLGTNHWLGQGALPAVQHWRISLHNSFDVCLLSSTRRQNGTWVWWIKCCSVIVILWPNAQQGKRLQRTTIFNMHPLSLRHTGTGRAVVSIIYWPGGVSRESVPEPELSSQLMLVCALCPKDCRTTPWCFLDGIMSAAKTIAMI